MQYWQFYMCKTFLIFVCLLQQRAPDLSGALFLGRIEFMLDQAAAGAGANWPTRDTNSVDESNPFMNDASEAPEAS